MTQRIRSHLEHSEGKRAHQSRKLLAGASAIQRVVFSSEITVFIRKIVKGQTKEGKLAIFHLIMNFQINRFKFQIIALPGTLVRLMAYTQPKTAPQREEVLVAGLPVNPTITSLRVANNPSVTCCFPS